jgi:hypothetical protein
MMGDAYRHLTRHVRRDAFAGAGTRSPAKGLPFMADPITEL